MVGQARVGNHPNFPVESRGQLLVPTAKGVYWRTLDLAAEQGQEFRDLAVGCGNSMAHLGCSTKHSAAESNSWGNCENFKMDEPNAGRHVG